MKIALAADHAGYDEKERLKQTLDEIGVEYDDLGTNSSDSVDYPDYARKVAVQILEFFDRSGFTRRRGNDHLLRDGLELQRHGGSPVLAATHWPDVLQALPSAQIPQTPPQPLSPQVLPTQLATHASRVTQV